MLLNPIVSCFIWLDCQTVRTLPRLDKTRASRANKFHDAIKFVLRLANLRSDVASGPGLGSIRLTLALGGECFHQLKRDPFRLSAP
jgi:hypothetical protein